MTNYVFIAPPQPSVAIAGTDRRYPVRRVYCIGRNYEAHVREMGHDPERSPPIFFCKPADAVLEVPQGEEGVFPYPAQTGNCHHEIELVVAIGKGGKDIAPAQARTHVFGYAIGLDMTRRDLQRAAAKAGQPWETGKAFDASAPMGPIHPAAKAGRLEAGEISLDVNGRTKQRGDLSQLIWNVDEIIAALSRLFELQPGDIIFTGTPEGVGEVKAGDRMSGAIAGLGELRLRVA
ncbi:MAG: fumarylacetoacetate hydrolase family protein [Burkholderiales bacterium]|nr:fumarylacetoacetate hydrolase family protein [Burkholderiales bacterium]